MSFIDAVATIDFPYKADQQDIKQHIRDMFAPSNPLVGEALDIFDNAEIVSRNMCKPIPYYKKLRGFRQQNDDYLEIAVVYACQAVREAAAKAKVKLNDITDILVVSTTGLATPSLDARIINQLKLDPHINRIPIWGLGCGGGVSGLAKADTLAKANPAALILLVSIELCSLTFLKDDFSKSNFVASSLFSDGIAACLIKGDKHQTAGKSKINIVAASSTFYYDTPDIMGWEFLDSGFKVVFSRDIPSFITKNLKADITSFLSKHELDISNIRSFIFHPGGKKVLSAYAEALGITAGDLQNSHDVMRDYGNMSSPTVLYVLEKFVREGYEPGYGLMSAMGPGFSTEQLLLDMA